VHFLDGAALALRPGASGQTGAAGTARLAEAFCRHMDRLAAQRAVRRRALAATLRCARGTGGGGRRGDRGIGAGSERLQVVIAGVDAREDSESCVLRGVEEYLLSRLDAQAGYSAVVDRGGIGGAEAAASSRSLEAHLEAIWAAASPGRPPLPVISGEWGRIGSGEVLQEAVEAAAAADSAGVAAAGSAGHVLVAARLLAWYARRQVCWLMCGFVVFVQVC
jgi:hypothetical protein